jgi:hypothetical protein
MVLKPTKQRPWAFPFFASSLGVAAFAGVWFAAPWIHLA